ncbi:MAG: hypothetical protein WC686_01935 [Candidatus Shapirobacteria bacterium]|jgi:hypothetical protein
MAKKELVSSRVEKVTCDGRGRISVEVYCKGTDSSVCSPCKFSQTNPRRTSSLPACTGLGKSFEPAVAVFRGDWGSFDNLLRGKGADRARCGVGRMVFFAATTVRKMLADIDGAEWTLFDGDGKARRR